jgi:pimeloyl-ACP methyl ester carboxylesterase
MKPLSAILAVITLVLAGLIAVGGAMAAVAGPFTPRGERVDIGGRSLRIVCAGPSGAQPLVMMEAGAFGLAADWAAIQDKLAAKGIRSCAYDRAGLGWSDPGPGPRDTLAITADLEALLKARGETGPLILMGHSMAGLNVRTFAARNPERVRGLVLIEAAVPTLEPTAFERRFVPVFRAISDLGAVAGSIGLTKVFPRDGKIGLPPEATAEKRRAYGSGRHMRTAAGEVAQWRRSSEIAAGLAPYPRDWPVAVILAGADEGRNGPRAIPAREAEHGFYEAVPDAGHASVLGYKHNDAVIRGLDFVLQQASKS